MNFVYSNLHRIGPYIETKEAIGGPSFSLGWVGSDRMNIYDTGLFGMKKRFRFCVTIAAKHTYIAAFGT